MFGYVQSYEKFLLCRNFSMLCYWNARYGAGNYVLLRKLRLPLLKLGLPAPLLRLSLIHI